MNNYTIKELFEKDINRPIDGVIKVDKKDEESVYKELDEYVLTQETLKHFDDFFTRFTDIQNQPDDKIGVWISGFFGSGKSHFIKMLAYLLENNNVKGKKVIDFFKEKISDPQIISNIEKSINSSSKDVILFNIDSKANTSGNKKDQIVNVLMKVFNEKRGYSGDFFWLAELEEDLDYKGLYDSFKNEFKNINGNTWESRRDAYAFEQDAIIKALNKINYQSEESLKRLFDLDGKHYTLNVEKFAKKVKDYCIRKNKDHQVIFLVDEIGQYIGESTDLMLNLQTITEELGVLLKGKGWIVVTSQADIDTITKNKVKSSDFSKIQGRFGKPLNLSSANVDEVITKRILKKKPEFEKILRSVYEENKIILKNLISFSQGTAEMKNYLSEENFSDVYPFIPYQFILVQKVFDKIRTTGFTGKHLAKGERSMLSAFKESLENRGEEKVGCLIPFYEFYTSIENFLDPIIKRTIDQAKKINSLNDFDIKILKTLFLIKNIKELKANVDNLTVLSVEHIDEDKLALQKKIIESLDKLKAQTLIHKTEDIYYFLTDEEQDVNRDIKRQEVDRHSIRDDVFNIIFDDICPNKYESYNFNKILDDRQKMVQNADLSVKLITPHHIEQRYDNQMLQDGSRRCVIDSSDTLLILFPDNSKFLNDLKEVHKINTYLTHNDSNTVSNILKDIYNAKAQERDKLKNSARENIKEQLINSEVYIDGKKISLDVRDATDFIKEGLRLLVENVYRKSNYIEQDYEYEEDIKKILKNTDLEKWDLGKKVNTLALKEIKEHIKLNHEQNIHVLLGDIKSKFMKKPYGWKEMTISGLLAILYVKGEISLKYQQEIVGFDPDLVTKYLSKRDYLDKIKISIREKTEEQELNEIKKIVRELFDKTNIPSTESELFIFIKKEIDDLKNECAVAIKEYELNKYPGKIFIETFDNYLDNYTFKNESGIFLKYLLKTKDEFKEKLEKAKPTLKFFKSDQRKIYSDGLKSLKDIERNLYYLSDEGKSNLQKLKKIYESEEPFSDIKNITLLLNEINTELNNKSENKKNEILEDLKNVKNYVTDEISKTSINIGDFKLSKLHMFDEIEKRLKESNDCVYISNQKSFILETKKNILDELNKELISKAKEEGNNDLKRTKIIEAGDFFKYSKVIENDDDLKEYMELLNNKLKEIIKKENLRLI